MSTTEEYNIKKILFNKYHALGKLCQVSKKLNDLNSMLTAAIKQIHPGVADQCRIINYREQMLYIETSRSEFLTTLKFSTTDLIALLRKNSELADLISIKLKVNPNLPQIQTITPSPINTVNKPDDGMKKYLGTIAEGINDSRLKNALLRLIDD